MKLAVLAVLSFTAALDVQAQTDWSTSLFKIDEKGELNKQPHLLGTFEHKRKPKKEEASYEQADKVTKNKLSASILIEREHEGEKLSRITNRTYRKSVNDQDKEEVQNESYSYSIHPSGLASSYTKCAQDSSFLYLGKSTKCYTINRSLCEHLKSDEVNKLLKEKIKLCSDTIEMVKLHQQALERLTKDDYEKDSAAISKINSRLSTESNSYKVQVENLDGISQLMEATKLAEELCEQENARLISKEVSEALVDGSEKDGTEKKSLWKKVKSPFKKINLPFVKDKPKSSEE